MSERFVFCDICGMTIQSDNKFMHDTGKKHKKNKELYESRSRRIEVTGFTPGTTRSANLQRYFERYGEIESITLKPDKNLAMIVFTEELSRDGALRRSDHQLNDDKLQVSAPAQIQPKPPPPPPQRAKKAHHKPPKRAPLHYCGVCQTRFNSDANYYIHMESKGHVVGMEEAALRARGFTVIYSKINWHNIRDYFSRYGRVDKVIMFNQLNYAHVYFKDVASRQAALAVTNHAIVGEPVIIDPVIQNKNRRRKDVAEKEKKQKQINHMCTEAAQKIYAHSQIETQFSELFGILDLTEEEKQHRLDFVNLLETELRKFIPEVCLIPYGSIVLDLATQFSETDVYLDLDLSVNRLRADVLPYPVPDLAQFPQLAVNRGMVTIESLMELDIKDLIGFFMMIVMSTRAQPSIIDIEPLPEAPIPTIRIRHNKFSDINLYIGPRASLAAKQTQLLQLLSRVDCRFTVITKMIRFWARQVGVVTLERYNSLSNYALTLLVYFYLQNTTPPVLPTVQGLADIVKEGDETRQRILDWDCSFCTDNDDIQRLLLTTINKQSIPDLLKGFFEFYANLDVFSNVLCLRSGKLKDVMDFRELMSKESNLNSFVLKDFLVQDVFDLSCNVAGHLQQVTARGRISQELIKAAIRIQRQPTWDLCTFIPIHVAPHDLMSIPRRPPTFYFQPTTLPLSFKMFGSLTTMEAQWHQWIVELTMKALKILRIEHEIIEEYDEQEELFPEDRYPLPEFDIPQEEERKEKRPLGEGTEITTNLPDDQGPTSQTLDRNSIKRQHEDENEDFTEIFEQDVFEHDNVIYSLKKTIKEETLFKCRSFCRPWEKRWKADSVKRENFEDSFSYEEAKTQYLLENASCCQQKTRFPVNEFVLRIQRYRFGYTSKIVMCFHSHNKSIDGRILIHQTIQKIVGLGLTAN